MDDYDKALRCFLGKHWDELRHELHIPQNWWNTILEGICKTDEFYEGIMKTIDAASVFEELATQLTTLSQYTPDPAPYTGQDAVQNVQGPSFDDWNPRCTVRLSYSIAVEENEEEDDDDEEEEQEEEDRWGIYIYTWGIYQKRGTAQYAIVLESTYWKTLQLYNSTNWDELANALDIANEWRVKVKKWFAKRNNFEQALEYMKEREAKGDPIYTKVREIFSPLRGIKFGDSERDDQDSRIAASIILDDQKGKDGRLKVHVWSLEVSGTDSFSDSTALEGGKLKSDGGELMYTTALRFYKERHWTGLRSLFDIKRSSWKSVLQKICQSESFGEVIEKRDDPSVFEELDKQLTGRVPDPSDALYTGDEAVQNVQGPPFDNWNHRCTVRLSYDIGKDKDRKRTYIWGIYQKIGTTQYAIMVEPTYWKALQYHNSKDWKKLTDALNIEDEWNFKVKNWLKKCTYFGQALGDMEQREARGDQIHTKVGEIFSQLRELKVDDDNDDEDGDDERNLETIASIILECQTNGNRFRVQFWSLKGSRKASTHSIRENQLFSADKKQPKESELVFKTARKFYTERHWAGLRNLLDIDRNWWDRVLKKLCQSKLFGKILEQLKIKEEDIQSIYPQFNNVFSWTRVPECKPEDVKVIIVGYDPVEDHKATGISFLIQGEGTQCKSIANIFKAVKSNYAEHRQTKNQHLCPYSWCTQGVLLLNTYMTIGGSSTELNRHDGIGWERITNRILEYFVDNTVDRQLHILLWHAYWNKGTPTHMERLSERAIGDNVELIYTDHPTAHGVNFRDEAPGVFATVNTIRWETITDGYPTIPAGVIHPRPST